MSKSKACHLQELQLRHGLVTKNEQWSRRQSPACSPRSTAETVSVTGLGFEVSVCKTGSGQGISASLFRQWQHHSGVYVGQRQKDSRKTIVAELYLSYHSRAGRESNPGLVRILGHTVLWPGLLGTFFFFFFKQGCFPVPREKAGRGGRAHSSYSVW